MRSRHISSLAFLTLLLATFLFIAAPSARAADDNDTDDSADEYDEHARVMRISLLRGEVSLQRAGNVEWESAKLNLPLVEGDTLATGKDSRLEIQLDARNFVRVGADSVLRVVTLREEGIALSLSEGTVNIRLARFDHEHEYFEVDAPKTTMAAEQRGLYRLDVGHDSAVRVTVRDEGRARIYSETSGFNLRDGKSARLVSDGSEEGDWEIGSAASFDDWDKWNDERERFLASRLRFEDRERYYDRDVWGAEELDAYGDWAYTKDYGYVWRPHITVINNYYNWAPYRYGHWSWCPPYGWTWVADEDWGWAPYHYGRWVYYNNNWCWAPRGYGYNYHRAWWRPALVAFVYIPTSFGENICWYPLQHGQRDPRGRFAHHRERLTPLRSGEIANLERINPALLRAVTTLPTRDFGIASMRARAATNDIARRVVTTDPVRGRLPMTPADTGRITSGATIGRAGGVENRETGAAGRAGATGAREGLRIVRPAPITPPRSLPERATGAATRTPGVALDSELRRARVFNNREPRFPSPTTEGNSERATERNTGVVARPARPERRLPVERTGGGEGEGVVAPSTRSNRPTNPGGTEDERRTSPDSITRPERRERQPIERVRPPERDDSDHPVERTRTVRPYEERPVAPRVNERPDAPAPRQEPEYRAQPSPRREIPPAERQERVAPPRQEQPRQETPPARREEPAPPKQERVAPPAPARSEPRGERPPAARSKPDEPRR